MATSDERNFRSAYYEKVGFKNVEEKKSIEILLKDKTLDHGKLKQFCLRYCVPATYRNLLWKILLGVIPVHKECHAFIMDQRKQEYSDLLHALYVLRAIDNNTPKPQIFLAMWILQSGRYNYEVNLLTENGFTAIVQSLMQFFEDDTDIYWIAATFYDNITRYECDFPKLIETTYCLLDKEDPALLEHFKEIGILDKLPLATWFDHAFAGLLHESALVKIWDKLCGGSSKIMAFVVVVLFTNLKHRLKKCNDIPSIIQCIKSIPEETADVIANKSIDMWQQQQNGNVQVKREHLRNNYGASNV